MATWAQTDLCSDADILGFESTWLSWTQEPASWRAQAKAVIEEKLRYTLKDRELATQAADVLDLVGNTDALRHIACYKSIELCARSKITNGADVWSEKARYYDYKFEKEIGAAIEMLSFDADESGTIEDSEKYQVTGAIEFTRGGPPILTGTDTSE